jgi:large subunit ribosomal protein L25
MELSVQVRENLGKNLNTLRKGGFIPAEFYGHGMKNEHLSVKAEEFRKVYKEAGENTIVNLLLNGKKLPSLIYEVKEDPLRGNVMHVDFYGVRMDEEIKANIPLEFTGEAPAVKDLGGIVNKTLQEVEVEALPANLPHSFIVDISALSDIGASIYVKDLSAPKGVKIVSEPEQAIVSIAAPRKEEEIVAPVTPVDLSEVKVETEEKKAEREAEKAVEEKPEAKA